MDMDEAPPPPPRSSSSPSSSLEEDPSLQSVTDFDFIALMDERGLSCVPETSFPHVETSQDCGVREGMVVEMPLLLQEDKAKQQQYWLATVLGAHGPLLRLSYVGGGGGEDIWRDLSSQRLYPLGWCQWNRISLEPPDCVKAICPDWQSLALQYEESLADTISMYHIDGEGVTPADRLKEGMMLEVQDVLVPNHFWPAVIVISRGGLLTLQYEGLEGEDLLTLFYTSNRLYPLQHGLESGRKYVPPNQMESPDHFQEGERIVRAAKKVAPKDLIVAFMPEVGHRFALGEILEIIPTMSSKVMLAMVSNIYDGHYFQVSLVSDPTERFLCHQHSDNIFPVGWSEKHLPEAGRVVEKANIDLVVVAADSKFPDRIGICEGEFEKGQKLEVLFKSNIRSATIVIAVSSVIVVEIDSDLPGQRSLVIPVPSTEIFPLGWSNANFIPCLIPSSFCPVQETENVTDVKKIDPAAKEAEEKEEEVSSWCPPIYFNYQCYSASFLSKAKLASLPKSVGPGSVYLVMKKVLELIIRSSFKSGSILKRLECKSKKVPKNFVRECLKAKSRVANLKADVEIPTRADQVNQFCREVCQKVGACPYLVSATLYDKVCPANCQSKPKSEFHVEEQSGIIFRNRGRRGGRKRRQAEQSEISSSKVLDRNGAAGGNGRGGVEEDGSSSTEEYSDETTEPPSMVNSRSASPENDSHSNRSNIRKRHGRKEWENILPRSAIRTRGAKLPDFKLHMKIRPTKKEQRAIAINSLRESIGYDRRVPGSKRAKTLAAAAAAAAAATSVPMKLEPAFKFADIVDDATVGDQPPPIREINLKTNPERWSCGDTARFLAQTADCAHLAQFMVQDEIDGLSFMLLDFPTVLEFWSLTLGSAIRLCQHIESVKLAYLKQFVAPNH